MDNYFVYHLHSDMSVRDSTTQFEDYIKKAKELNMKGLCFSEHGNVFSWVKKKQNCEKAGLKFVFGIECYLTENPSIKTRDNYHTVLIAKNHKGVKELLKLISVSSEEDHFYYSPRISFDEFLNLSDNIISTSACLGSPLNNLDTDNPYFEKLCKKYNYYEIQCHNTEKQIKFNKKLYELSKKYNKKLIVGTDTHEISKYKQECRKILKVAKKQNYEDEDSYDLSFKTFDELVFLFKEQNSLDIEVVLDAIQNTNLLLDTIENFELDSSNKYPDFYENEEQHLQEFIDEKLKDKIHKGIIKDSKELRDRVSYEFSVFKKQGMCGFMSFTGELTNYCWENNIPIGDGRGSVCGSEIAYILDITDVDALKWKTNFSRFCNEDRVSLADIDMDFYGEDRDKVFQYIENRFGKNKSARIVTFGTITEKGTIEEICRGLKDNDNKRIYQDVQMEEIKKEFDDNSFENGDFMFPNEYMENKYKDLFYFYKGLIGTTIRTGFHPAGIIGSPINLNDTIGLFYDKKNNIYISQCNMKEIDSLNFVKFDILGLKNIGILKGVSELLGEKYKKSYKINFEDKNVWEDMMKSQIGIFQMEADNSFQSLKDFKTDSIDSMSFINALIRPSCESFRDNAIKRIKNDLPNKELEKILGNTMNYLTYQEQIIDFLHLFCGYTMPQADLIRRAIGKKDPETIQRLLPEIREGYIKNRNIEYEVAYNEFEEFYKVIDSASSYGFSRNHSTPYSMIGFRCALDRYYHPAEFIASYLNTANDMVDINNGTELSKIYNIKIKPITLGISDSNYTVKNGEIYKGMKSVAFINSTVPKEINSLYSKIKNKNILLKIFKETSVDIRQLEILSKINYFKEFGKPKKILKFIQWITLLNSRKTFDKNNIDKELEKYLTKDFYYDTIYIENKKVRIEDIKEDMEVIKRNPKTSIVNYYEKVRVLPYCKENENKYIDLKIEDILEQIWNDIPDEDFDFVTKIQFELEHLGYIQSEIPKGIIVLKVKWSGKSKSGNTGAWAISLRNNKDGWFTFEKKIRLPNKDSIIIINEIKTKEYEGKESYKIISYNVIKEG